LDFAEIDQCKPVLLGLSLAGNPVKPLLSLYGTEWRERGYGLGPQLVFTLNNRFFRHQACYSLLPAKPGGQADRIVSLCKYKVVG
jgi:hypothetical protein